LRESGLGVNMTFVNGRSVNPAYPVEISEMDAKQLARGAVAPPPTTPNETIRSLAILGGVLIDGQRSAIQPCLTPAEAWKKILKEMDHSNRDART
jgi:hypothetical protein